MLNFPFNTMRRYPFCKFNKTYFLDTLTLGSLKTGGQSNKTSYSWPLCPILLIVRQCRIATEADAKYLYSKSRKVLMIHTIFLKVFFPYRQTSINLILILKKLHFYPFVLILIATRSTSQTIHKVGTSIAQLSLLIKIEHQI